MLDSISVNEEALIKLSDDRNFNSTIRDFVPDEEEFDTINQICELLYPLTDFITILSASHYPTISFLFPIVYSLINGELEKVSLRDDELILLRDDLLENISCRFDYVMNNDFFLAATFLDNSFKKFSFISDASVRKAHISRSKKYLHVLLSSVIKEPDNNLSIPDQQVIALNETNSSSIPPQANIETLTQNNVRKKKGNFLTSLKNQVTEPSKTPRSKTRANLDKEIANYENDNLENGVLEDPELSKKYGPLLFFKQKEAQYPILCNIAKAVFSTMPSSTPVESLFSSTGLIDTDMRTRLSVNKLENLVMIKRNNLM
jgi:hypothetical protein